MQLGETTGVLPAFKWTEFFPVSGSQLAACCTYSSMNYGVCQSYIILQYQLKSYFWISIKFKGFASSKLGSKPKQPQITFLQE